MSVPEDDEIAFYRAVEDHFAALRGTPFLLVNDPEGTPRLRPRTMGVQLDYQFR